MSILDEINPQKEVVKIEVSVFKEDFNYIKLAPEFLSKKFKGIYLEEDIFALLTKALKDDPGLTKFVASKTRKRGRKPKGLADKKGNENA